MDIMHSYIRKTMAQTILWHLHKVLQVQVMVESLWTQTGSGSHTADITVENGSGGAQTYTLLQQGSTNQSVTVSFTCNTAGGCSASLTQGS